MNKKSLLVSVIITTKNEAAVIKRLINSVVKQSYKNIEIILVDNFSTDGTVEIAKQLRVKVYNMGPERSAQRNFGVKKSKGEFVLIIDADMELEPSVIDECVKVCSQDKEIGGVVIPEESIGYSFWEKVKAFERSIYNLEGDQTTDAARFFTRDAFDKVGGFDVTITGPEDWDFPENVRKNDFKIGRIKSKILHFERIPSLFNLAKKKYYYALKANRYLKKNSISIFSPKTIYFLRPVFYKNWKLLFKNPLLTLGMIIMLTIEQIAGSFGYITGKLKSR